MLSIVTRRIPTTLPSWRMRTIVLSPRLATKKSESSSRVVLLAQVMLSASRLTGARSTGNFSEGELMRLTEPLVGGRRPKTWFGVGSEDHEVDDGNRVVERLADKQLPRRELRCRVWVHEHAKPRLDTLVRRIPAPTEKRLNCACRRDTIQPLLRVFLDDRAVRGDDGEHRPAGVRPAMGRGRPSPPRLCSASLR